jgi:hypothetical protein
MVHSMCKQREKCTKKRPNKSVDRNGAVGIESVAVDKVTHTLPKRNHTSQADEGSRKNLWYPCNVWVTCPRKPKEAYWKCYGANDHGWKALFGDGLAMLDVCARKVGGSAVRNQARTQDDTDEKRSKW